MVQPALPAAGKGADAVERLNERAAGHSNYADAKLLLANFAGQVYTQEQISLSGDPRPTQEYAVAWRDCMEMMLRRNLSLEELAEA